MPKIPEKKVKTVPKQERIKWSEFRENWKDCEACPLHQTRYRICLAKGQVPCDLLFIGEAPGMSENVSGKPFDGKAGRLLHDMIMEAEDGLPTGELKMAFTNTICCIPIESGSQKADEPEAEHAKACYPRLIEFVERVAQPKMIILVGKFAAKHFAKSFPGNKRPTFEITHPAALLRADVGNQGLLIQRNTLIIHNALEELLEMKCQTSTK